MIQTESNRFGRLLYILYPGDYFATGEECLLATVTGACAVVCLHDASRGIGGLGHFIVPGSIGTEGLVADEVARHGTTNLEYLIGEIVKLGGDRKALRAKLFGAGSLNGNGSNYELSKSNIWFLHEYFEYEKIPVVVKDLGGTLRRKLYFYPKTGDAFRRYLKNNQQHSEFMKLEQEYIDREFEKKGKYGKLILFD